jgi:hypothetical protein
MEEEKAAKEKRERHKLIKILCPLVPGVTLKDLIKEHESRLNLDQD